MSATYEARRISKQRLAELRKARALGPAVVLDTYMGFIIVQPSGSNLGDGAALTEREADYELQSVWYPGPPATLRQARKLLGLGAGARETASSGA
jgi:hypothetical protein